MRPLLVAGGRVLHPEGELHRPAVQDILVEQGRIVALGVEATVRAAATGAETLDATGKLVTPGFVNAHSHSHDALLRGCFEGVGLDVWGLSAFPTAWPRRPEAEIRLRTLLHAAECLMGGMTTVQDMVTLQGPDQAQAEAVIAAYRETGLRVMLGWQFGDRAAADTVLFARELLAPELLATFPGSADPAPMQTLVRALLDRVHGPLQASVLAPSAPQRCSGPVLDWVAALSRERGIPVCTHVYETRAQAVLARECYREDGGSFVSHLERHGLLGPQLVVAHGVWIADAEIERLGDAGAHLACNPAANLKLLNGAAPLRRYAEAGVNVSLGSDNSSAGDAQSLFHAMRLAALYRSLQGGAERDAAAAAFRAATVGGAQALGLQDRIGRIQPGFRADLVLFDLTDPAWLPLHSAVRQLVYAEAGRSLDTVLVEGRILVRDGRPTQLELSTLAEACAAARDSLEYGLHDIAVKRCQQVEALSMLGARTQAYPLGFDRMSLRQGEPGKAGSF